MKLLIWMFVVLILLLGLGLFTDHLVALQLESVTQELETSLASIQAGDWESAQRSADAARLTWENSLTFHSALFHNQPLDNISHALWQVSANLPNHQVDSSLIAANHALNLVALLINSDDLSLGALL